MLVLSETVRLVLRPMSKRDGLWKVLDLSLSPSTLWDHLTVELQTSCQSLYLSAAQGSGLENFSFNTHFENEADYGAISDRINEDDA